LVYNRCQPHPRRQAQEEQDLPDSQEVLPNFIVLEGLDGAGTSTQLRMIDRQLNKERIPHCCTFEPTRGHIGRLIWDVLKGKKSVHPYTLALLFAADRKEHLEQPGVGIISRAGKGELVVTDRYLFSSLAYQSIENGFQKVLFLNARFPLPSHLFFIDTSPEVCQERMLRRRRKEIFDRLAFQRRVCETYQKAFDTFSNSKMVLHRIDGNQSPEVVFRSVWNVLQELPILRM
jgi:dTMP kinase